MATKRSRSCRVVPAIEWLEDRRCPAVFLVNSTQDLPDDDPGDGFALATDPLTNEKVTTLRAAIMEANALPGVDQIYLPYGNYLLSIKGSDEDDCRTGDLDILEHVEIIGAGADFTIVMAVGKAFGADRIFDIHISAEGSTLISGITIFGGQVNDYGGGIRIQGKGEQYASVTLEAVMVMNCYSAKFGGGVYASFDNGWLYLLRSTITLNTAANGGGVAVEGPGGFTMINSTISQNLADFNHGVGAGYGGGLYLDTPDAFVIHATIFQNGATVGGGIYTNAKFMPRVAHSIVAGNNLIVPPSDVMVSLPPVGPDVAGFFSSIGYNLIGDGSGADGFVHGVKGDLVGSSKLPIDPMLGPLLNNGGPTPTHMPQWGSPAIDHIPSEAKLIMPEDQRLYPRPRLFGYDIGAVEAEFPKRPFTDIVVDITTPDSLVRVGRRLNYTIVVTNAGPGPAPGVRLVVTLSRGVKYLGFQTSHGWMTAWGNRELHLELGDLLPGEQVVVEVFTRTRARGLIRLFAEAPIGSFVDTDPDNNRDIARHYAGRPLYIDDRILALLLRDDDRTEDNGNGGHNGGGRPGLPTN
jgi:uncharacterized repeat protein (TIGR01451 family)